MGTNVKSQMAKQGCITAFVSTLASVCGFGVTTGFVSALALGSGTEQPKKESIRNDEIKSLKRKVSVLNDSSNQSCIVVGGDKGIGKTCMITTALKDTKGAVQVKIAPGTKEDDIMAKC